MRIKILILSLILILTITINCFAVDEIGNVLFSSFSFDCNSFTAFNPDWSVFTSGSTSPFSSNFYNRMYFDPFVTFNGIYSIYNTFSVNFPSSVYDFNFISINVDVGAISSNVLISNPSILFYIRTGNNQSISVPLEVTPIIINYSGTDFSATNISFIADVSSLELDISLVDDISLIYEFRTSGSFSSPFVMTPMSIDFYKNYQDVIVDVNSNVQELINQNDIIINNLGDVNDKLDEFINSDIDESKQEEFEDEISKDIEDMESINNLEESLGDNANDKLNISIDYDTSFSNQALKDVLDNNIFSNFFNYLFDFPFVVIGFTLLPFLWFAYILLYRG